MANVFDANTHFVDTTALLQTGAVRVVGVRVQGGSAVAGLVLRDGGAGGKIKVDIGDVSANTSQEATTFTEFKTNLHATISGAGATAQIDIA